MLCNVYSFFFLHLFGARVLQRFVLLLRAPHSSTHIKYIFFIIFVCFVAFLLFNTFIIIYLKTELKKYEFFSPIWVRIEKNRLDIVLHQKSFHNEVYFPCIHATSRKQFEQFFVLFLFMSKSVCEFRTFKSNINLFFSLSLSLIIWGIR